MGFFSIEKVLQAVNYNICIQGGVKLPVSYAMVRSNADSVDRQQAAPHDPHVSLSPVVIDPPPHSQLVNGAETT
jgi:hypothetical protein